MPTLANLVIRDAHPHDHPAAGDVLADAFHDGAVTAWAEPDPTSRAQQLRPYFTALLGHAATHGIIRLAQSDNAVVGAAVWFPHPGSSPVGDVHDLPHPGDDAPVSDGARRLGRLDQLLKARHPATPHHHLAYLGVAITEQNRGIGTALIGEHHADLRATRTPAYLEANDPRNRELYRRLGYTDLGQPVTAHDGPPIFPMWWTPDPDSPRPQPATGWS